MPRLLHASRTRSLPDVLRRHPVDTGCGARRNGLGGPYSRKRSTVGREEGLDVSLLLRPTGRGVDERLELESDERFRVDHRDTQPGTAEEPVPGPAQHVQGSLATSEDEVDWRESRRPPRIVRG